MHHNAGGGAMRNAAGAGYVHGAHKAMTRRCAGEQRARQRSTPNPVYGGGRTRATMRYLGELSAHGAVDVRQRDETDPLDVDALLGVPQPSVQVYCCGPESLLSAVETRCAASASGLHVERFAPKVMDRRHGSTRSLRFGTPNPL